MIQFKIKPQILRFSYPLLENTALGGALGRNWYVRWPQMASGISKAESKGGHARSRTIVTEVGELSGVFGKARGPA